MALEQAGLQLIAQGAAAYIADMAAADKGTLAFVGGVEGAGSRVNTAAEVMTGALRRVGEIGVNALGTAAQAAGQFVGDSITAAADFEGSVNNLAAISGTALEDAGFSFDDLSDKALQLGQDTKYSASESIDAMTELVKGGIPIADVMGDATDATLALAAASGTELGPAAEIVSKQLGVWGETGATATEVADLLTQAANASTVGVEDLAQGLAQAGGTAKTAGVEYNDLVQTMGLIAPGFSSASDAGTSLKTFISRLIPTTDSATDAMVDLGLATEDGKSKFFDASGAFIGMEQAAGLLQDQTKDLSEEQRLQAFNTIFGADAIRAASAIAGAGAEGFRAFGGDMAAAGGAAATAAKQNQGFTFAMDSLKGSVETLQIVLGTKLLPILTDLINTYLIPGVAVLQSFAQALFGDQEALAGLDPVMQTVVGSFQGFMAIIQPVVDLIGANLVPVLGTVAGVLGGVVVASLVAAAAPFAPLIAAITAAIAIGAALWQAWDSNFLGIQELVSGAMAAVQDVITSVMGIILDFWKDNGEEIMTWARRTWDSISEIIGTVVAIISEVITRVFGVIASFLSTHGDTIELVLETAWNNIKTVVDTTINVIKGILTTVLALIRGDWQGAWDGIKGVAQTVWDGIKAVVENNVNLIKGVLQGLIDLISGAFKTAVESIQTFFSPVMKVFESVKDVIGDIITRVGDLIKKIGQPLRGPLEEMQRWFENVYEPVRLFRDTVSGIVDSITLVIKKLKDWANTPAPTGGGGSSAPKKAMGGPVEAGTAYTVGELGRELFIPEQDGQIVSNYDLSQLLAAQARVAGPAYAVASGAGGPVTNYYYAIDARGSTLTEAQIAATFDRALAARTGRADRLSRIGGGGL